MISYLLVTCCLEPSRADVLRLVIDNIKTEAPELLEELTVFDNHSTEPGIIELLSSTFKHVYVSDKNVGYWSAIDWWLSTDKLLNTTTLEPKFTYIIESDMIHYAFNKIQLAGQYLLNNSDVGAVRLHEYSVKDKHLYNKDAPTQGSKTNIWQSHINKVTGKPVVISPESENGIHRANFLTQLPALNRYASLKRAFVELAKLPSFSELDFQRLYHQEFAMNAIIDGGIFHCNPGSYGVKTITSSWTDPTILAKLGYQGTRQGSITLQSQYKVSKLL
jgi:hypothetical protein